MGEAVSVLVIAEPGCTAQGDYRTMVRLLETAAACGANVWKPQWTSDAGAMASRRNAPDYLTFYRWLQWPLSWHQDFKAQCTALGMQYACSVYLPQDVWPLEPYVDLFKISSFEESDWRLVTTATATGKTRWVSAGMTSRDCWRADDAMHCTSAYPAPVSEANLLAIQTMGFRGYSDHTRSVIAGSQAVAYGAKAVEAHYRLDDCDPMNPDYAVAFTPAEFTQYIRYIREAEAMQGDGKKTIQPCEQPMLRYKVQA